MSSYTKYKDWEKLSTKDKRGFFMRNGKILLEDFNAIEDGSLVATQITLNYYKKLIATEAKLEREHKAKKTTTT